MGCVLYLQTTYKQISATNVLGHKLEVILGHKPEPLYQPTLHHWGVLCLPPLAGCKRIVSPEPEAVSDPAISPGVRRWTPNRMMDS
jgi:hypothetical protein